MMNKKEYILKTGENDEKRLDALAAVYQQSTEDFLSAAGLEEGMTVADFGCGIGNTTRIIAKIIGKKGKVLGIDNEEKQLEIAEKRMCGCKNIRFEKHDVYNLSNLKDKFDFIFGRLLLINLKRPEDALREMLSTLNAGGVIASEEFIDPVENFCYPRVAEFDDHVRYMKEVHKSHGFNPEIGKQMKYLFVKNNISLNKIRIFQPILETELQRSLPYLNVSAQNTNEQFGYDKENMKNRLKLLIKDDNYLMSYYNVLQICGKFNPK